MNIQAETRLLEINAAILDRLGEGERAERMITVQDGSGFASYSIGRLKRLPSGKVLHQFCFPPVECDFCDLLEGLQNYASDAAKHQGLKVAHCLFRFQHEAPPQMDLLRDAALLAHLRGQMLAEIQHNKTLHVEGLQVDVTFELHDEEMETEIAVLALRRGRWKTWNGGFGEAIFESLRETNGQDIRRIVIRLEGDDWYMASDPPKPAIGFLPLTEAAIATKSQSASKVAKTKPVPFDQTELLKIDEVFQRRLGLRESVKINCFTFRGRAGAYLSDPEFSNPCRHEYCDGDTVKCEICAACVLLRHVFADRLEHAGLEHGVGEFRFRKGAAPKLVVFEKARLKERLRRYLQQELHWEELFRKASGMQIEVFFDPEQEKQGIDMRYLVKIDGKWQKRLPNMDMAYFPALRETYGNDITHMVIYVDGDDFWIATEPPKPRIGFLPLSQVAIAEAYPREEAGSASS